MGEIKTIWLWFDNKENHKIHPASVIALKILLLTGVRSGSLRLAEWNEFDFDNNLWTIPVDHLKLRISQPRQPQKIHLTELTKKLFFELKELSGCKFALPGKDQSKPILKDSLARTAIRTQGRIENIEPWTPHDLRRTFSTQLNNLGVDTGIVEKCLGHKLPAIMATYNKSEHLPERAKALELWADKIGMLVTNDNVIPFRKVG